MATANQLLSAMRAQPFRPFQVKLADGRSFLVRHPEFVSVSVNGRELVVHDDEGMHLIYMPLAAELLVPAVTGAETG
jgi:hypothetical protein